MQNKVFLKDMIEGKAFFICSSYELQSTISGVQITSSSQLFICNQNQVLLWAPSIKLVTI